MSEYIKIDEAEYEKLLEEARSRLETMSPEQISELRAKCNDVLSKIIEETEKSASNLKSLYERWNKPIDYDRINPFKQAKKRFWLGQLVNFIAVAIFKLPRELTPVYGYPHNAAEEYDKIARNNANELLHIVSDGKNITEATVQGFSKIKESVVYDDATLVAFCNSCENLSIVEQIVKASAQFKEIASLFYLNNVSFDAQLFRSDTTSPKLTDRIHLGTEEIKRAYEKTKSNGVNKHM